MLSVFALLLFNICISLLMSLHLSIALLYSSNFALCSASNDIIHIKKNKLYVQAGGGVVYDSDPELEYNETVNKAKAVLNAAEIALGNQ